MLLVAGTPEQTIENSTKKPKNHLDKFLNGKNGTASPSASPSR